MEDKTYGRRLVISAGHNSIPQKGKATAAQELTMAPLGADLGKAKAPANSQDPAASAGIQLKREIGLWDGVALTVGSIIASGIFVSPKGILKNAGSVGLSLIIWVLCGVLSLVGALCYAELGTMIPKSGGDYAYISEAFGPLPSFLYLWVSLFVIVPTGHAISSLTFAQYILQPIWPDCAPSSSAVRIVAGLIICLLTAVNCYDVKLATKVQGIFTSTKIVALIVIVIAGFYVLGTGELGSLKNPMAGTSMNPGHIAVAFYQGLFPYTGWNMLNLVTEELKNPFRNLPRAISISLPLVTLIYLLANIAYFVVLTQEELLASNAVAVTFGDKVLGAMSWTMPFFVACSTFGGLNGAIFVSARLFFVGARDGQLPAAIALINVKRFTPVPSLVFLGILSLVLLFTDDVYVLITYITFVEALVNLMSVSGLLWLRRVQPDLHRPIKVNIILPVVFFIICTFLVILPCSASPVETGVGVAMILSGIPFYYIFVWWQNKPKFLLSLSDSFNLFCAKIFECALEDKIE